MTTEERLERLERELAETRAQLGRMHSVEGQPEVRAQRFLLVDEKGHQRGELFVRKDGSGLRLEVEKGLTRVQLDVNKNGAMLSLFDDTSAIPRAQLGVTKDGPMLSMFEHGQARAVLLVHKNGTGLTLGDENGEPIWRAP